MNFLTKKIGFHREKPRMFFQTLQLIEAGFAKGTRYDTAIKDGELTLKANPNGKLVVSGKELGGKWVPVIDINSGTTLAPFDGMEAVTVYFGEGEVIVAPLASEKAAQSRLKRMQAGVASVLMMAGLAFGAGMLDWAAHQGFAQAGLDVKTVMVNEIDGDLIEHASKANPVIGPDTMKVSMPMQELVQDAKVMAALPVVDVLVAGIPCSGASKAGKSKHGISMMEDHPEVGHLVHPYLTLVQRMQPGALLLENVPEYAKSASASIIRSTLRDMGYTTYEVELNAMDYGAMENRNRWFLVGLTKGLELDLTNLAPPQLPVRTVADILDGHGDHHWGTFDYLKAKAVTDKAAGKGFAMQIVNLSDTKVPVLRKGYHKGGSTDPLLKHPTDKNLLRLFSGDEHARIKGVPPELVAGLSNTDKHIVLGQGVATGMVTALVKRIGECIKKSAGSGVATTAGYRLDRTVG